MRRLVRLAALAAVTLTLWPQQGIGQPADEMKALKKEIETLREGQVGIQKELQEIKGLLRARPSAAAPAPPQEVVVSVDGAPFKGERTAKVTVVDFTDYQ
jgi:protein-disulfide isomerase